MGLGLHGVFVCNNIENTTIRLSMAKGHVFRIIICELCKYAEDKK